jgi:uncharacterized membrane protein YbhN (UPF0104 family)
VIRIRQNLTGIVFLVGLIVATLVLWLTGVLGDAWDGLRDANPIPLALVVVVGMISPLVHAWRWKVVMRSLDVDLSIGEACDITVSSALVNYASPGFVGASAKAVLANQTQQVRFSSSALAIGFEHTLDLLAMAISAGIVILIIGPEAFREAASPLEALASFGVVVIVLAVVAAALVLAWKLGAFRYMRNMASSARQLGSQVNVPVVGALTFLYWFLQVVIGALMFWAVGIDLVLIEVLAIVTVPGIAGMLAPLPGGVGVKEAVTVALTAVTGISAATLVTLAIVQRVLLVASLPLALGVVRLARRAHVRFA